MPQKLKVRDQTPTTTRDRILQAALVRFAQHSYDETKLRDIADVSGVDVAYVHRCFGSKEQLFSEVVNAAFEPRRLITAEDGDITTKLTRRLFEPSLDQALRLVDPLDILIRSLLSPEAIPLIRSALMDDVIEPLGKQIARPTEQRAALAIACLTGFGIFRHVLQMEAMLDEPGGQLEKLFRDIIDVAMGRAKAVKAASAAKTVKATLKKRKVGKQGR